MAASLRLGGQVNVVLELQRRLVIALARHEPHAQVVLDGEDGVVAEVLAVLVEDLRHQRPVAVGDDHEVDVRGAEDVSVHQVEQLAGRAVRRDLAWEDVCVSLELLLYLALHHGWRGPGGTLTGYGVGRRQ